MSHFKDTNGNLHFLDDDGFSHLLPDDCVKITDKEAEAIRISQMPVVNPQDAINAEALAYLAENDWVLRKIYQADIEGLDIAPLKLKYADILAGLNSARLAIK